ncbi:hypothetical protein [Wenyingzhuangia sp. IMCC45574]
MKPYYYFIFSLFLVSCAKKASKENTLGVYTEMPVTNEVESPVTKPSNDVTKELKSMEEIALEFINGYTENCNQLNKAIGVLDWVYANPNTSKALQSALSNILEKAERENPGYGLGFDPIFNAQDFPEVGFVLVNSDMEKGIVNVKGKGIEDFEIKIKMLKEKGKWLVNGVGIVNM